MCLKLHISVGILTTLHCSVTFTMLLSLSFIKLGQNPKLESNI